MAFMATSSWTPVRSIPARMSPPSSFTGTAERTVSLAFTFRVTLGFTSRETTEATVLFCRYQPPPPAATTRARQAADASGAQRRFFFRAAASKGMGACSVRVFGEMRDSTPWKSSGAACSSAVRSFCSSS